MKRNLKSTTFNALCISLLSAFYASIFILYINSLKVGWIGSYEGDSLFWTVWNNFLASGNHQPLAAFVAAMSVVVVALLLGRTKRHDEYHALILTYCLAVAAILTVIAIAVFYMVILCEPSWFIRKFTLFVLVHWITVVVSNLAYVLICQWR
ncbi:MAG: hypothetical protein FWG10_07560 [Eubacteriaceae bacterium]|nr:hypothetical protein [Eubacteriaceae bacterium]